jgi:hypothetical protein
MSVLIKLLEAAQATVCRAVGLNHEHVGYGRAQMHVQHHRAGSLLHEETVSNLITNVGRDFLHTQGYGLAPAGNGLNFIALSNDPVTENAASTTLSNEIAANGLTRAAGTPAHTAGTNTTTVTNVFTCATAPQSAQKAALFTALAAGTMNHVLGFTPRALLVGDTLSITFTITLG